MTSLAETILSAIDARRAELVDFLQGFVRTPTSNPPGDTRDGAAYLENFLKSAQTRLSGDRTEATDAQPACVLGYGATG